MIIFSSFIGFSSYIVFRCSRQLFISIMSNVSVPVSLYNEIFPVNFFDGALELFVKLFHEIFTSEADVFAYLFDDGDPSLYFCGRLTGFKDGGVDQQLYLNFTL